MRGVTLHVTIAVVLGVGTILEATYLERPLWVADKGRVLSEQPRAGQVQAGSEQYWLAPERYYPLESQQWPQEQPPVEQKVREEQLNSFQSFWPYEYQGMDYGIAEQAEGNDQEKQVEPSQPTVPPVTDVKKPVKGWPEYPSFNAEQGWDVEPKPDATQPNQYKPEQQKEPSKQPETPMGVDMQPNYGMPQQGYDMTYNPYPPRPELYWPGPSFVDPMYQMPYYEPQNQMQEQSNRPFVQPPKPQPDVNRVKNPQQEPAVPNINYNQYVNPQGWSPYQQQEIRAQNNLPAAKYPREQAVPEERVPQVNRQPALPSRVPQRPSRPIEREPEQPIRVPSPGWETEYRPVPAPVKPRPPVQRPAPEPTYNRRPEQPYYGNDDDDDEVIVNYERPVTRYDSRCPRNDNPSKPVHFPSATSCVKFQKCFNGIAYEMSCPSGLEFDSQSNRCDYPARAKCSLSLQ
uniref:Chitin-binding type-2 domain-containing protein n=1 Tax=Anopheles epiroticus TaxID=199890 RepID=A0A182P1I5_9DIPT